MKIGILTFHRAINYGAFLQVFALQFYLKSKFAHVDVVDYWPDGHARSYSLLDKSRFRSVSIRQQIKYLISCIIKYPSYRRRLYKMHRLQQKYLKVDKSPAYNSPKSLEHLNYDCIIYGSDQIWWKSTIKDYEGFDEVYWGDYVKSKSKISYAASMGVIHDNQDDRIFIGKKMNNFDHISVREVELQKVLSSITQQSISLVCDPVFLLNKKDWSQFLKPYNVPRRYVLLFNLTKSDEVVKVAEYKAKELNCTLLEVTPHVQTKKIGRNIIQTADSFEFIYIIKNAEFIVTSSFHATAFSIIFNKQFYSLGMGKNSGRVQSLLSTLGIPSYLKADTRNLNDDDIDYSVVEEKLQNYVNTSITFLNNSLPKIED